MICAGIKKIESNTSVYDQVFQFDFPLDITPSDDGMWRTIMSIEREQGTDNVGLIGLALINFVTINIVPIILNKAVLIINLVICDFLRCIF